MNTQAVKERPILFSGPMVRAILERRKTQTRRIVKPQPEFAALPRWVYGDGHSGVGWYCCESEYPDEGSAFYCCPYGKLGERLWVRETWRPSQTGKGSITPAWHKADGIDGPSTRWKPSIFMPRWACRLELEIISVRVQRLHDITEEDAFAEGVKVPVTTEGCPPGKSSPMFDVLSPFKGEMGTGTMFRWEYARLWDSLNAKRGFGWAVNPWVWVIEFKPIAWRGFHG